MNRNGLVQARVRGPVSLAADEFWVRILLGFTMLVGASVLDLRSRRVSNLYWYPFLAFAAVLLVADIAVDWRHGLRGLAMALGLCALFYAMWWFGLLFGGADAKGLMVLALLWPGYERVPLAGLLPAADVLVNGALATLLVPLVLLATNVLRGRWAGVATVLAVPRPLEVAKQQHVWPLQRAAEGQVRWRYWQGREEDQELVYRDLERAGIDPVWVTPKVPFMVPLAVGLVLAAVVGNVVIWLMVQMIS